MKSVLILFYIVLFQSCHYDDNVESYNSSCFSSKKIINPCSKEYCGKFNLFDSSSSTKFYGKCLEKYSEKYKKVISDTLAIVILNHEDSNLCVFRFEWENLKENVKMKNVNQILGYNVTMDRYVNVFYNCNDSKTTLRSLTMERVASSFIIIDSYEFYFPNCIEWAPSK